MAAERLAGGDLLWLLGSLCRIGRRPFDAALVSQEFPPPITTVTLHEAARALGFRTGARRVDAAVLPGLTFSSGITPASRALAFTETLARFPCIAFLRAALAVEHAPASYRLAWTIVEVGIGEEQTYFDIKWEER